MSAAIYRSADAERLVLRTYDAWLDRSPFETTQLATRHGEAFVVQGGPTDAPDLVMLHSASSNSSMWGEDLHTFCREFRVHAVDLPGEPGRSAHHRLRYDDSSFADWLSDVLDGLGLSTTRLLGYSLGGWVALRFAVAHPGRVRRLGLVAPGGVTAPRLSLLFKLLPFLLLGRLGRPGMKRVVLGSKPLPPDLDAYLDLIADGFLPRRDREVLFTDEELRRLAMPAALVTGSKDTIRSSARIAERLAVLLPKLVRYEEVGSGHLLSGFATDLAPFFRESETRGELSRRGRG